MRNELVNKSWIIIKSCFKKSIKQIIAIFILTIAVSLILNVLLTITLDYKNNFKKQSEKLNASSFTSAFYNLSDIDVYDNIINDLENNKHVTDYQVEKVISGNGIIDYGDGLFNNIITIECFKEENRKLDKYEILSRSDKTSGVYVSYIFDITIGLKFGDHIKVKINNDYYDFEIIGFYNSVTTGSINCTDFSIYATEDIFNSVKDKCKGYRLSVNLDDCDLEAESALILEEITKNNPSLYLLDSNALSKIETSRYTNSSMFQAIMLVASIILLIVLICILAVVLNNYVKNNIKNFGTLKATGYSSSSLILPLLIAFIIITLIACIIGVGFSYLVLPIVNNALEQQVGIPYTIHFLWSSVLLSISICVILNGLTTLLSILKIRKIAPINAIRENKGTKEKIGNVINFDKSKLNINFKIGINNLVSGISRTLILFFAFIGVSFLLGFSAFLYQNVIKNKTYTVNLICGQLCNSIITVLPSEEENLKQVLSLDERVENYYMYNTVTTCPKGFDKLHTYVIEKDCKYINAELILVEGSMPKNCNEIAINKAYASKYNLKINDKIQFDSDYGLQEFSISGLTQGAFHAGLDSYLIKEGYNRIGNLEFISYYVDLENEDEIDKFNEDISNECNVFSTINESLYIDSIVPLYCLVLYILGVVIVLLSIIISCFVLYILLSIFLENKKREHGILMSTGFTSKNILTQTFVCILPECILGTIIGLLLSRRGSGLLITLPLRSTGIFHFANYANWLYILIVGIFIVLLTIFVVVILSRNIKKISPHDLFNRE